MRTARTALAALSLVLASAAAAQNLQNQLIGTWDFVVAQVKAPDGKISFPFGESPKGMLVFTPDGRFMQIHVASDVPRIAANNRLKGTPEEYSEIMRRSI
ncbi:MAG TPA: lipocalin-like domain-containing protein, partial [Burkholderiales bacterium]|nr:lipocalin-like domain-containing protein [Burkholderiales bacterium]